MWHKCKIRLFAIVDAEWDDPSEVKEDLRNYLKDHRLVVDVRTVALNFGSVFSVSQYDLKQRIKKRQALHSMIGYQNAMSELLFNIHHHAAKFIG